MRGAWRCELLLGNDKKVKGQEGKVKKQTIERKPQEFGEGTMQAKKRAVAVRDAPTLGLSQYAPLVGGPRESHQDLQGSPLGPLAHAIGTLGD